MNVFHRPFSPSHYRDAVSKSVNLSAWDQPVAVTLTMRQVLNDANGGCLHLDHHQASANLSHFLKRLNRAFFGNAVRHGRRVNSFAVLEKTSEGRLHYHALIDRPQTVEREAFDSAVELCWSKTKWAQRQIDIQHSANEGWLSYMLKARTKTNFYDDIDWTNAHLPSAD